MKRCLGCGKLVIRRTDTYCSSKCYGWRQCEWCQQTYYPKHGTQRFCGKACASKASAQATGMKRSQKCRAQRFVDILKRLPQKLTREDLLIVFQDIYRRGYQSGEEAARRQRHQKPAA